MDDLYVMSLGERAQGIPEYAPFYTDDFLVSILLGAFLILSAVLSDKEGFLGDILKGFFLPREESSKEGFNTMRGVYMRIGTLIVSFLSVAVLISIYVLRLVDIEISLGGLILLSFGAVSAFYIIKQSLFWVINWTFFDVRRARLWRHCYANWLMLSGVIIYPCVIFMVFLDCSANTVANALLIWLILAEICLLFKAFHIFLTKKYGVLQLFVYLCTLELIPLLFLGKALVLYV